MNFRLPFQQPQNVEQHYRNAATMESWAQRYALNVRASTDTSVANGSNVKIKFDTIIHSDIDSGGLMFRASTNDMLIPSDGLWVVTSTAFFQPGPDSPANVWINLFVNGTVYTQGTRSGVENSNEVGLHLYEEVNLRKNDVIDIRASNGSGAGTCKVTAFGAGV